MRYIVFDVETPNYKNDSICAIGIAVVENGEIVEEQYHLVDPEDYFSGFNIKLHGVSPVMVEGAMTFPELWFLVLEPMIKDGVLVAHNAPFDMGVLSKSLKRYGIHRECDSYACTVRIGRMCIPEAPNHKLNTLCELLGIDLLHHNAGSDSLACAELLLYYISKGVDIDRFVRKYEYK